MIIKFRYFSETEFGYYILIRTASFAHSILVQTLDYKIHASG